MEKIAPCRVIADSGAFSAKQNTETYQFGNAVTTKALVAWTKKWEHLLCWVACIDVASAEQTKINWDRMCQSGLQAVSTLHVGDHPSTMDWYAERGVDFLGLGGMAGSYISDNAKMRWMIDCFKYARENHPDMRFHGWGITHAKFLRLPFFSVDSSGWGSSYRYGRISLRNPLTGETLPCVLDGKSIYDAKNKKLRELLIEHYGVSPSEIAKAGPANRVLLVKLSALSASVQEQEWRKTFRKQPIYPPSWGRLKGWTLGDGPNQHLALSGCGAGIRERKAFAEFDYGPHMHLVDGFPPHLRVVAELNGAEHPEELV